METAAALALIVLGLREWDTDRGMEQFVAQNLDLLGYTFKIVTSTDHYESLEAELDESRVVVLDPIWNLFLWSMHPRPIVFSVRTEGSNWRLPYEDADFMTSGVDDDSRFQRAILSWLADSAPKA
ncbi:MAG TPA: hypothetical protein VKT78_02595 [Fimbriimonadaceae bacterium]|nr:hypothetical protein [Fimbriimonadaceae bacterium]